MPLSFRTVLPLFLVPLAACSSGGGSGSGSDGSVTVPGDYQGRSDLAAALTAQADAAGYSNELPASGSAHYSGVMNVSDGSIDLLGDTDMAVNFSTLRFGGSGHDFVDSNGDAHTGSLNINGELYDVDPDSGSTVAISVTGNLVGPDTTDRRIDAELLGHMYRSDAEYMYADSTVPGGGLADICNVTLATCSADGFVSVIARDDD